MKKIAFIKCGAFSKTNYSVLEQLNKKFDAWEVDVIDIYDISIKNYHILIINLFASIKEHGLKKMLKSKKHFLWCYFSSTYFFYESKKILSKYISPEKHIFSLQTMTFFDASQPGLHHFLYTDDTVLARLYYPNFKEFDIWSPSRIHLERATLHNATVNFTMSTNIRKSIIEQYGCDSKKVVCVYAGSNTQISLNSIKPRNYHKRNILFVGVDWERKGGPELVEAFKLVTQVHPDAQLTIVGCSPKVDLPNCHVVGRVSLQQVFKYYEDASVFCLPTTFEPFGIVFIEAFMYKLPVVATDIAAIPDFVKNGENGYLVKPKNIPQIAQALNNLLANPNQCKIFGEEGHRLVTEIYSWDKVGYRMKEVIESVVNLPTHASLS
jgi:glycosyltransferase involved in cell wall biosynthesis